MVRAQLIQKLKHFNSDKFIAVGNGFILSEHNKVELFTLTSSKWQIKKEYSINNLKDISWYSILAAEKKFIIFGGFSYKFGTQSTIARFDPVKNSWEVLGNLKEKRHGHSVIKVDNEFIVVGGVSMKRTESCKLDGQSMVCTTRQPKTWKFAHYPELMLMP